MKVLDTRATYTYRAILVMEELFARIFSFEFHAKAAIWRSRLRVARAANREPIKCLLEAFLTDMRSSPICTSRK
jgi:hypothetical protein